MIKTKMHFSTAYYFQFNTILFNFSDRKAHIIISKTLSLVNLSLKYKGVRLQHLNKLKKC